VDTLAGNSASVTVTSPALFLAEPGIYQLAFFISPSYSANTDATFSIELNQAVISGGTQIIRLTANTPASASKMVNARVTAPNDRISLRFIPSTAGTLTVPPSGITISATRIADL
jgi:hypothetical protein